MSEGRKHLTIWPHKLSYELELLIYKYVGCNIILPEKKKFKKVLKEFKCKCAIYLISHEVWEEPNGSGLNYCTNNTIYVNRKNIKAEYRSRYSVLSTRCSSYMHGITWKPCPLGSNHPLQLTGIREQAWDTHAWAKKLFIEEQGKSIFNMNEVTAWELKWESREDEIAYFRYTYSPEQLRKLFEDMKYCNCCKVHKYNCPKHLDDIWDEQSIYRPRYGENLTCTCPCRHYKRIMTYV